MGQFKSLSICLIYIRQPCVLSKRSGFWLFWDSCSFLSKLLFSSPPLWKKKKNHFVLYILSASECSFSCLCLYFRPSTRRRFQVLFISHFSFFPFDLQRSYTNLLVKSVLTKVSSNYNSNTYIYIFILWFSCNPSSISQKQCLFIGCFMVQSCIHSMNEKSLLLMHAYVHQLQRSVLFSVFSILDEWSSH